MRLLHWKSTALILLLLIILLYIGHRCRKSRDIIPWTAAVKGGDFSIGPAVPANSGQPDTAVQAIQTVQRIPRIFHQAFTTVNVFEAYKRFIQTCLNLNPDWKYYLWTEEDAKALIERHYPQLMPALQLMQMRLERSDVTRYVVLHKFGGVYLDMDIECTQPLIPTIEKFTAFTGRERDLQSQILWDTEFMATNAALGSVPGHPFFKRLIDTVSKRRVGFGDVMHSTGPLLLTEQLKAYWLDANVSARFPVTLTPAHLFMPLMDEGLNWSERCRGVPDPKLHGNKSAREIGCAKLRALNGRVPLSDVRQETIGVHHWKHLGYLRNPSIARFNASEEFLGRVHFYARNKSTPAGN